MIPWIGQKLHALPILLTRWWNSDAECDKLICGPDESENALVTHFRHFYWLLVLCIVECAQVPLSEHFVKNVKMQFAIVQWFVQVGRFIWSPLAIRCIFIDFGHLHLTKQYFVYNPIDCRAKSSVHSFASFGKHWVSEQIFSKFKNKYTKWHTHQILEYTWLY